MKAEEILDAIDALPWKERLRLFRHIYDRVMRRDYKEFIGIDETFARYHKAMFDITGEDCTEHTRRRPVVWARYIVAWQMTEDGFTTNQIGARLGIDHSTVSHCRDAVKEMLEYPRYYPQELAVFRKFKKTIQDEIHTRTNAGAPAA